MKSRILVIALALVFVAGLSFAKNNVKGNVTQPSGVTAEVIDDDGEKVEVCWTTTGSNAEKWSVVLIITYTYTIAGCEATGCNTEAGEVEVEVDFGTLDEEAVEWVEGDGDPSCLKIDKTVAVDAFEDALEAALGTACYECLIITDDYGFGTVEAKVKGLAPGKGKGRQNNMFSSPLVPVDPWELVSPTD